MTGWGQVWVERYTQDFWLRFMSSLIADVTHHFLNLTKKDLGLEWQ